MANESTFGVNAIKNINLLKPLVWLVGGWILFCSGRYALTDILTNNVIFILLEPLWFYFTVPGSIILWLFLDSGLSIRELRQLLGKFPTGRARLYVLCAPFFVLVACAVANGIILTLRSFVRPSNVLPDDVANRLSKLFEFSIFVFEERPALLYSWLLCMGFAIVIMFPIVEEVIFRGILLTHLRLKWNITIAIILSSAVFSCYHSDAHLHAFVAGLLLSAVYLKTRTLIAPILCHALVNLVFFGSTLHSLL